ncbi:cation:proton antiporter [Pediococcus pentosaceus]|uniref:cation:proton antiporter n=1 Tax=Pediococcus pentosaceus TaxID=1255 RepID=UPI0031603EF9
MSIVFFVLILIIATVFSNALDTKIKFLPRAIIQIMMGLALSFIPNFNHFNLNPEVFMLAIIAPLMFYDGMNTNIVKLKRTLSNTFSLAIGLAVVTIILVGYLGYALLPHIPIALAFALAAIITPTDAVAVSSVTENLDLPNEAMLSLKNESLFNDASGIVMFDLALTAFHTGHFSPVLSIFNYLYVFFGGLIVGWIAGWLFVRLQLLLIETDIDNPNIIVPINFIKPFAIYLLAEMFDTSGILAVVAAGLIQSTQAQSLRLTSTKTQMVSKTTYEIFTNLMNGFVFILLGVSFPTVIYDITNEGRQVSSLGYLILVGIILYIVMIIIRYLWVTLKLANIRIRPADKVLNHFLIAINGIHGTITLSMAFSIPIVLHGKIFPFRNDIIFIAATVIILSLLVPSIILPLMLPAKTYSYSLEDISTYRQKMIEYAIKRVHDADEDPVETQAVIATLRSQQSILQRPKRNATYKILQKCFNLEEKLLQEMVDNGEISVKQQTFYERMSLFQSFQLHQSFIQHFMYRARFYFIKLSHRFKRRIKRVDPLVVTKKFNNARDELAQVENEISPQIFAYLREHLNADNRAEIHWIEEYYRERHRRFQNNTRANEIQEELFINAFQNEYNFIQEQLGKKNISRELASLLYEQVSNDEWVYMQNDSIYA